MKLTAKLETLLLTAVRATGSYDPSDTMHVIEESLTLEEYQTGSAFLGWVHRGVEQGKVRHFGHSNIRKRFGEFKRSVKAKKEAPN